MKARQASIFRFGSILFLTLALLIGPGCDKDKDGHDDSGFDFGLNDPMLVVSIGDSITEGGYPAILSTMIEKPVVNQGVGGTTSGEGISSARVALSRHPGYLLILYGANDVIQDRSLEEAAANLRAIIGMAKANQTIPCIATTTPMAGLHIGYNGKVNILNEYIRQIASEEEVRLADLYKAFDGKTEEYLLTDGLHPNDVGNRAIAAEFMDACF